VMVRRRCKIRSCLLGWRLVPSALDETGVMALADWDRTVRSETSNRLPRRWVTKIVYRPHLNRHTIAVDGIKPIFVTKDVPMIERSSAGVCWRCDPGNKWVTTADGDGLRGRDGTGGDSALGSVLSQLIRMCHDGDHFHADTPCSGRAVTRGFLGGWSIPMFFQCLCTVLSIVRISPRSTCL
jgi:hypothetical protein